MFKSIDGGDVSPLSPVDQALAAFAIKITREPWTTQVLDIRYLRTLGLCDRAIHDAVQVIAYFNYINRIADGLGVDLEPDMPPQRMEST